MIKRQDRYRIDPTGLEAHYARLMESRLHKIHGIAQPLSSPVVEPVWHVVFTNPRCEERAAKGLLELGYRVFVPKERVWVKIPKHRQKKGQPKKKPADRALYPRYVFIGLEPARHSLLPAKRTDGVADIVSIYGKPLTVPKDMIEKLSGERHDEIAREADAFAAFIRSIVGKEAIVENGPFAGLVVTVERVAKRQAAVEAKIMGRTKKFNLPLEMLKPPC